MSIMAVGGMMTMRQQRLSSGGREIFRDIILEKTSGLPPQTDNLKTQLTATPKRMQSWPRPSYSSCLRALLVATTSFTRLSVTAPCRSRGWRGTRPRGTWRTGGRERSAPESTLTTAGSLSSTLMGPASRSSGQTWPLARWWEGVKKSL